jgi:hypothetical protein
MSTEHAPEIVLLARSMTDYVEWNAEYPELAETIDRVVTPQTAHVLDGLSVKAVHYTDVVADHPSFGGMRIAAQFALMLTGPIEAE